MSAKLLKIKDWERLAIKAEFKPGKLAAEVLISHRHLERHFREQFRTTPRQWMRELQCRIAQELIARGYSTRAVAAELHYASASHFCHEFKKICGVSPQTFAPSVPDA